MSLDTKGKTKRIEKGKSIIALLSDYVIFDIETTGLSSSRDEIIEIAAIKVRDNKIVDRFNRLVKPDARIDEFITELTGITNEMVADAPSIKQVLPEFMDFIGNGFLMGHNVNFDINFVYDMLEKNGLGVLKNDFVDTMRFAKTIMPGLSGYKLINLADYFNVDASNNHRALKDCVITFEVYQEMKKIALEKFDTPENVHEEKPKEIVLK